MVLMLRHDYVPGQWRLPLDDVPQLDGGEQSRLC
jgi:hypothetical protein